MVQIHKAEIETGHREQMYGHQGEKGSEMNWETAIDMYVLTMIKQITKGTQRELCSGLCGDPNGRGDICICMAIQQKITQYNKATMLQLFFFKKLNKKKTSNLIFKMGPRP